MLSSRAMKFVEKALVMDSARLNRVLSRMASEIVERNGGHEGLVLVGVKRRGIPLAERIAKHIAVLEGAPPRMATIDVAFYNDDLSTVASEPIVSASSLNGDLSEATLVIVDDVLYTGRTVWAAVQYLLMAHPARRVQLATLIDRGHHELPIQADFVGRVLATRDDEIVKVMLNEFDGAEKVLIVKLEAEAAS